MVESFTKKYKTAVLLFARMSSERLPGKALLKLGSGVVISQVIKRAKKINADILIVATSDNSSDDVLVDYLESRGILCYRGSLKNVAERTVGVIKKYKIENFIRINGDSPLLPVDEINKILLEIPGNEYDLITNLNPRSFPYGYSIEIINSKVFTKSYPQFSESEKEHITSYFYKNSDKFKMLNIKYEGEDISNKMFLTIDDSKSYDFINHLYYKYPKVDEYSLPEIIKAHNSLYKN